jgi:hypothetical protein
MFARAGLAAVVIPGVQLALVDPELAIEKVQLLDAGVGVRRILAPGARRTSMLTWCVS